MESWSFINILGIEWFFNWKNVKKWFLWQCESQSDIVNSICRLEVEFECAGVSLLIPESISGHLHASDCVSVCERSRWFDDSCYESYNPNYLLVCFCFVSFVTLNVSRSLFCSLSPNTYSIFRNRTIKAKLFSPQTLFTDITNKFPKFPNCRPELTKQKQKRSVFRILLHRIFSKLFVTAMKLTQTCWVSA